MLSTHLQRAFFQRRNCEKDFFFNLVLSLWRSLRLTWDVAAVRQTEPRRRQTVPGVLIGRARIRLEPLSSNTSCIMQKARGPHSQVKHQVVESFLWYAVMEPHCEGESRHTEPRISQSLRCKAPVYQASCHVSSSPPLQNSSALSRHHKWHQNTITPLSSVQRARREAAQTKAACHSKSAARCSCSRLLVLMYVTFGSEPSLLFISWACGTQLLWSSTAVSWTSLWSSWSWSWLPSQAQITNSFGWASRSSMGKLWPRAQIRPGKLFNVACLNLNFFIYSQQKS